jgi:glycosyltransferase involved in cell wall biosynthesis
MRIHYISYGIAKTGGYWHEKTMFEALVTHLGKSLAVEARQYRKNKLFTGIIGYIELLLWSFFKSNGDINIVTARSGIPAMLRNLRGKNQVWIVLHNFDSEDGKSAYLAWYYERLFSMLRKIKHKRFKVISVSPFWLKYFRDIQGLQNTYLFPNLFDLDLYEYYRHTHKNAWVHLGQFSKKNDPDMSILANSLSQEGYSCYFSTLDPSEAKPFNGSYEIRFFDEFADYLDRMSRCCCTLALTRINEGWNRVAHESILVGTPVIGYARGGLGDLLKESSSVAVKNLDEAYTCIKEALWVLPNKTFIETYDIKNAENWLIPICRT